MNRFAVAGWVVCAVCFQFLQGAAWGAERSVADSLRVEKSEKGKKNQARIDETLSMVLWEPYAPEQQVDEFKRYISEKYQKNITVSVKYVFSPNEFYDGVRAGRVDIISPSHNLIQDSRFDFIKKGLVIPLDQNRLGNLRGVEQRFLNNTFVRHNEKLYGVPFATGLYSLLYRKSAFSSPPESWNILWDPRYRKRYAISREFYESNLYVTALASGIPPNQMMEVQELNTQGFRDKLKELLHNALYWQGVPHEADVHDAVLTTAWGFSHSVHPDRNQEWLFAFPREGVTMWTDYLLVSRAVKRSPFAKTLAYEWLNFVISPQFQRAVTINRLNCYSAVPAAYDVAPAIRISEKEKRYFEEKSVYWPVLNTRNRNGLKLLYDQSAAGTAGQAN
ncbi:hypothetical protein HDN1F_24170 [gamma proteobacterium HdN1]|nr:hypothetical protein HDN1F_24170 [gamma proteobacterium HdN1]